VYRLAAWWAALAVPLWIAAVWLWPSGIASPEVARSADWHARAMVSGFVGAVVVAFLVAPVRRWPGDRGALASALVALWGAARLLSFAPPELAAYAPFADLAFFALAAGVLARRALRAPVPNNLLFAAAPLVFMLSIVAPLQVLQLVPVLIAVLAGRLIPGLVNARLRARPARIDKRLDALALGALLVALVLLALAPGSVLARSAALLAALLQLGRWWGWSPFQAMRADLRLAILLIAYAWMPVWLLCAAAGDGVPPDAGRHALAVGLVGGMTWAMMNRTLAGEGSPGHLERIGAFALVLAALTRFALPFATHYATPGWPVTLLVTVAATSWSLAFASLALRQTGSANRREGGMDAGRRAPVHAPRG
jgi:uncharacterized protein involved in response to NO